MSPGRSTTSQVYGGYAVMSATALCCYEHLLTFNAELQYIWRRRFSAGSVLFVVNRYAVLVASLASIAQVLPWFAIDTELIQDHSDTYLMTCNASFWLANACYVLVYLSYAVFAALRMYALYGKHKVILVVILFVGIVGPCALCVSLSAGEVVTSTSPHADPLALQWGIVNCHYEVRANSFLTHAGVSPHTISGYFSIALRLHSLLFELTLLGMTWNKTFTQWRLQTPAFRAPFTTVLLRDGTLYFMAILVAIGLNTGGIAMVVHILRVGTVPYSEEGAKVAITLTLLGPLVDAITSICMSRFLLGLLAAAEGEFDTSYRSSRWDTVLRFAQVETLGGPLRHAPGRDSDNEDGVEDASHLGDAGIVQDTEIELGDMRGRARCSSEEDFSEQLWRVHA